MALITIERETNLNKVPISVDVLHGMMFSKEAGAHKFIVTCTKDGEQVQLTGAVTAYVLLTNGHTQRLESGGTTPYTGIENGKAWATLHQACYAVPGRFQISIFVTDTHGVTTCVYAAVGVIQRSATNNEYDPGDAVPTINNLEAWIAACQQATEAATAAAQGVDDIVLVQSAQPTSESNKIWIQPQADEYQVPTLQEHEELAGEVDELKSAITNKVYPEIYYWKDLAPLADADSNKTNNYYLSGLGGAIFDNQSGVRLYTYPVTAGDYVKLVLSNDTAGTYQWQDSKNIDTGDGYTHQHVIGDPVTGAVDATVKVPTGATYLIVSQLQTNTTNKVQVYDSRMDLVETDIGSIIAETSVTVTDYEQGKYINRTGGVSNYAGVAAYSTLIPVKKGDVVTAKLYANSAMSAISYVTADYVFKRPAVIGRSYSVEEYTLEVEHTGWICLSYYMSYQHTCTIKRNVATGTANLQTLSNKFIIWCGDSIMRGNTWNDTNDGWAGRVADLTGCRFKNYGVGGSTITNNVTGGATPTIYTQIETAHTEYPDADYVIFDGGCNDADLIGNALSTVPAQFGTWSETDWSGTYDTDTFCGAFETICKHLSQYWLGKHVGYIIPHKMGVTNNYTPTGNNYRKYYETAIQICHKWGIQVLNLWDGCYLNPKHDWMCDTNNTMTDEEIYEAGYLYADRQHLTSVGYDYEGTIVAEWIKGL